MNLTEAYCEATKLDIKILHETISSFSILNAHQPLRIIIFHMWNEELKSQEIYINTGECGCAKCFARLRYPAQDTLKAVLCPLTSGFRSLHTLISLEPNATSKKTIFCSASTFYPYHVLNKLFRKRKHLTQACR
jgi:hypothetical protein